MAVVKPAVAKACAPKALHDVGASPDSLPDKLRLKVFNHQKNWTLIQAEDPWRHPTVQIGASVGIGWIKTGIEPIRAAPFQFKAFDGVTDRLKYDLRCEWERSHYRPG